MLRVASASVHSMTEITATNDAIRTAVCRARVRNDFIVDRNSDACTRLVKERSGGRRLCRNNAVARAESKNRNEYTGIPCAERDCVAARCARMALHTHAARGLGAVMNPMAAADTPGGRKER